MALHSAWPAGTPRIHWTFAPKTPEIGRSEHEGDEVGSGAKEGVLYLLDTDSLGGMDHQTPLLGGIRLGNDPQASMSYGIWGGLSAWRDDDGRTWLYVPLYGEPSTEAPKFPIGYGEAPDGSVMAFEVVADEATRKPVLEPAWISQNFKVPEPVALANGVAFVLANGENPNQRNSVAERQTTNNEPAVLYALDARTGKELNNSGDSIGTWVHFSGIAIAEGRIFAVDYDSVVCCFGLRE